METKHTKGATMNFVGFHPTGRNWKTPIYNEDKELVFEAIGATQQESEANAKLIAATPDLLETLKNLNKALNKYWENNRAELNIKDWMLIERYQQESYEAIKKATE